MWEIILIIVTSLVTGALLAMAIQRRPKFTIIAQEPLSFTMPNKDPSKAVKIISEKIWFINKGQPEVKNIEMTCSRRPAGFYFIPETGYAEENLANGGWRLTVPSLKTGETIELYMMNASTRKKFRFKNGSRIAQQPVLFPIASNRVIRGAVIFAAIGIISSLYIIAKTAIPFITPYL
jgi:hypothetical protein